MRTRLSRYIAIASIVLASCLAFGAVETECMDWFAKSKIKFDDPKCVTSCAVTGVDLNTFHCTDRCDELCRPSLNCDVYRRMIAESFTDEAPISWDEPLEKTKKWKVSERSAVTRAILILPEKLVQKSRFKIHRMGVAKLIEYFLFDPQRLKKSAPSLFGWFQTVLGVKFKLGGACVDGKTKTHQ